MPIKLQVLVVDDSALMRKLISDLLTSDPGIEVVDTARDGLEAVQKVAGLRPDVVTLDVEMPGLSGLEALGQIMQHTPTPVVMLTGLDDPDIALEALQRGAVDFVLKPSGTMSVDLYKIRAELIRKVRLARLANLRKLTDLPEPRSSASPSMLPHYRGEPGRRVVVIGASTGGPRAVEHVLAGLPAELPAAVLVVQHMPAGFTRSFAERLDRQSALRVREAEDDCRLSPGHVFVAAGGYHMRIHPGGVIRLDQSPPVKGLRPAADLTMIDVARVYGPRSIGVVLTGMGSDGTQGAQAIKAAGGLVVAQDQATSVVYGMPRAVAKAVAVDRILPLTEIPAAIAEAVVRKPEHQS